MAWHPLGWRPAFFSEIETFPCAVLAERWPGVPIHGDFTTISEGEYEPIELLVGGTPCQDFSVAGLRAGLAGDRGGLTIEFVYLARRLRPRWLVWENVPGILSIDDGRAFGAFLALLGQCGYGFAYRICDAQHFGVPQRRRRVFVVGYLGDWRPAAAVLFEPESLRGDSAPRRETGERIAASLTHGVDSGGKGGYAGRRREDDENLVARPLTPGSPRGSGYRNDADTADNLIAPPITSNPYGDHESREGLLIAGTLVGGGETERSHGKRSGSDRNLVAFDARNGAINGETTIPVQAGGDCKRGYSLNTIPLAFGGNRQSGALDVATAVNAHGGPHGRLDFESETFIAHSLRADGFDASEDGTGRGTPLTLAIRGRGDSHDLEYRDDGIANAILTPNGGRAGIGVGAVAFQHKASASNSMNPSPISPPIDVGKSDGLALHSGMTVRRLTPRECERLQGFPDDYTLIPLRNKDRRPNGKWSKDGPRYRALGNSMAVPCMRWIGERINQINNHLSEGTSPPSTGPP